MTHILEEKTAAHNAKYPEHAKMRAVKADSQKLGAFLEWCAAEKNWFLADTDREPVNMGNIEKILAEYFEIDTGKVELEKRTMLDELRKMNEK